MSRLTRLLFFSVLGAAFTTSCSLMTSFDNFVGPEDDGGFPFALDSGGPPPDGAPSADAETTDANAEAGCVEKTTGARDGTLTKSSGAGALWTTPDEVLTENGTGARVPLLAKDDESMALVVQGFGF